MTQRTHGLGKILGKAALLATVGLAAASLGRPAEAAFLVTITEIGDDVIASGSGSLNLAGLTPGAGTTSGPARVQANLAVLALGFSAGALDGYTGFTGPGSFGSGLSIFADSFTGVRVTIQGTNGSYPPSNNVLYVPAGYTSGSPLAATATFNSTTLAGLGLTQGTYVWSWGSGPTADSFTVQIAVPEPASALLLGAGLLGLAAARRRKPA